MSKTSISSAVNKVKINILRRSFKNSINKLLNKKGFAR